MHQRFGLEFDDAPLAQKGVGSDFMNTFTEAKCGFTGSEDADCKYSIWLPFVPSGPEGNGYILLSM